MTCSIPNVEQQRECHHDGSRCGSEDREDIGRRHVQAVEPDHVHVHRDERGPADAANVILTDALPLGSNDRVAVLDSACTLVGAVATCGLGTIAPLATRTVTITIVLKGKEGYISNTATVASATFDPDTSNNSSTRVVLSGNPPKP